MSEPPKNALVALFSAEVRPMCIKIPENLPPVQIIMYQVHLRLYIKTFRVLFGTHLPSR